MTDAKVQKKCVTIALKNLYCFFFKSNENCIFFYIFAASFEYGVKVEGIGRPRSLQS